MKKSKKVEHKMTIETYALSFVDMLGQKNKLDNLRDESLSSAKVKKTFDETYGAVKEFRNCFTKTFQIVEKETVNAQSKYKPNELKTDSFSDLMTNYVSLRNDKNFLPLKGIHNLMYATGGTFLQMLSISIPVRGAIEIGKGMIHTLNGYEELYGEVLSTACQLESKAGEPRIIIGPKLYTYIKKTADAIVVSNSDQLNQLYAKKCLSMIIKDNDKQYIINYLSECFPQNLKIYQQALEFINKELSITKKNKDIKLDERYSKLKKFFLSSPLYSENLDKDNMITIKEDNL